MSDDSLPPGGQLPLSLELQIDVICDEFEAGWRPPGDAPIEPLLNRVPAEARSQLLYDLLRVDRSLRERHGLPVARSDRLPRIPGERPSDPGATPIEEEAKPKSAAGDRFVNARTTDLSDRAEELAPGTRIDHFQIIEHLGGGSFGHVYRALDTILKREVALKLFHDRCDSPELLLQLRAEAEVLATLDHKYIVPVYQTGEFEGRCYFVSKLVSSGTLADLIQREGPLPAKRAAEIVAQVADALAHFHAYRFVHRDVKPANILLANNGDALLADFGMALTRRNFTFAKHSVGTPQYMSPEQVRGDSGTLDGRSDIFSLGVVLYRILTGQTPYRGETRLDLEQEIMQIAPTPPRQLIPTIPVDLQAICLRCLEKNPDKRYSTAADLSAALRTFVRNQDDRRSRWKRRVALAAGVGLLGLAAVGVSHLANSTIDPAGPPVVEQVELYVQRNTPSPQIESRVLIANGKEQSVNGMLPLDADDRFVLYYRFARPTPWYLIHVDPKGGTAIVAKSLTPTRDVRVPNQTGKGVSFRREDPKGVNLLFLVAGQLPKDLDETGLAQRIAHDGGFLQMLPPHWSQLRAGMQQQECAIQLPQDFLRDLEKLLPVGITPVHALFLQSRP